MLIRNKTSWTSIVKSGIWLPAIAVALLSGTAQAQFVLLDDFEGIAPDTAIDGTSTATLAWEGGATHLAVVDSGDASNQVVQVLGENGGQRLRGNFSDPATNIASGAVGTVFYRFRTDDATTEGEVDTVIGLTDTPDIGNFNFKAGVRLFPRENDVPQPNTFDVRNAGAYESVAGLASLTWYKAWVVADNTSATAGTFQVYLQSDDDPAFATQTLVSTASGNTFNFRINGATDILNVYLRTGGSGTLGSEQYYDDFYINSSAADLTDPTASLLLGDVDLSGEVDFDDIAPFIGVLSSTGFQAEADIDGNGMVDFDDIAGFIGLLSDG